MKNVWTKLILYFISMFLLANLIIGCEADDRYNPTQKELDCYKIYSDAMIASDMIYLNEYHAPPTSDTTLGDTMPMYRNRIRKDQIKKDYKECLESKK